MHVRKKLDPGKKHVQKKKKRTEQSRLVDRQSQPLQNKCKQKSSVTDGVVGRRILGGEGTVPTFHEDDPEVGEVVVVEEILDVGVE